MAARLVQTADFSKVQQGSCVRITALIAGGALALAVVVIPIATATSAHAATVPVYDADELVDAFASATGADTVVELGASFTVAATDGSVSVPNGATVTLDMNGMQLSVAGAPDQAAVSVNAGSTLHIVDSDDAGTSSLDVIGGASGAGIGSDINRDAGKIIIDGVAEVTAQGGSSGAGIGGGQWGSNGEVEIFGGSITATGGGAYGAGIGGGVHGDAGMITIYDGVVNAEGAHDDPWSSEGAGIGGAGNAKSGLITILGGEVIATGHGSGAGIGGGGLSSGSNEGEIIIAGGNVTAVGGEWGGSGIGSGYGRDHGPVTISDAIVTATGGGCSTHLAGPAAAIGHSGYTTSSERMAITIHDADVIADALCATSEKWAAAIGGAAGSPGADVSITGDSDVVVDAPGSFSAIGGGSGAEQYFGSLEVGLGADLGVDPDSALVVPEGATVSIAGVLWLQSPFINRGVVNNTGAINVFADLINYGDIENSAFLMIAGTGTENHGFISNNGEVMFFDNPLNHGIISNDGELVIVDGLVNAGIIRGPGTVEGVDLVTLHNFVNEFQVNDGSGSAMGTETVLASSFADAHISLPQPPMRAGFNFVGWNAERDGSGERLEAGTTLGTAAATLGWFAQWQAQADPDPIPDPDDDPDVMPTPAPPASDATQGGELAQGGQGAPTALTITGIAVLLVLGGALAAVGRPTHRTRV